MEEKTLKEKMNAEDLQNVAGGQDGYDWIHDLSCFIHRTVCNVIHYDDSACLTLRKTPDGVIIPNVGWQNGEHILVHGSYSEEGWLFAYKNGFFGFVNPNNVR